MIDGIQIIILVATDKQGGIGYQGKLPRHSPEDLRRFANTTQGHCVIMGGKTWRSLPDGLPGRTSFVLSRELPVQGYSCSDFPTLLGWAVDEAKRKGQTQVYVIGGAEVYALAMPFVDHIEQTLVGGEYLVDTFFKVNEKDWRLISNSLVRCSTEGNPSLSLINWKPWYDPATSVAPAPANAPIVTWGRTLARPGETLQTLEQRFNTTVRRLLEHNPQHPDLTQIQEGDSLYVPYPQISYVDEFALIAAQQIEADRPNMAISYVGYRTAHNQVIITDAINRTIHAMTSPGEFNFDLAKMQASIDSGTVSVADARAGRVRFSRLLEEARDLLRNSLSISLIHSSSKSRSLAMEQALLLLDEALIIRGK